MNSFIFLAVACPEYDFGRLSGSKPEGPMPGRKSRIRLGFLWRGLSWEWAWLPRT